MAHADCIRDPANVAANVSAFLGGGLPVEAMSAVVDPDLYRQRGTPAGGG